MNKYTLGTILGTALLGLAKSKGSKAKVKIIFDSAIDIRAYYHLEASFIVDEGGLEQQSSEQQSSEQQSSWEESFDREEMLENIESDIKYMIGEIENELLHLAPTEKYYDLSVHVEAKKWRDEGYEVEVGFYLRREHYNIDTWIDIPKIEEEFMNVLENIADQSENIINSIIESNFDVEGAEFDYLHGNSDLEINENSSRIYVYAVDEKGVKKRVNISPFKTSAPRPNLRKR